MNYNPLRTICFVVGLSALLGLSACGGGTGTTSGTPTLVFSASTNTIPAGQSVTLKWTATNATSVTITATAGSSTQTLQTSGQLSGSVTDKPTQTTTYTAVASGAGGSTQPPTGTVQVAQGAPQIKQFTATSTTAHARHATPLTSATST